MCRTGMITLRNKSKYQKSQKKNNNNNNNFLYIGTETVFFRLFNNFS